MKTDWWENIERAYHDARDLKNEDRSRFLDDVCGSDAAMRGQIEALLQQDDNPNSLLNRPAADLAAKWPSLAGSLKVLAGTRVGAYEILEPIGSGGMGDVYRARDTKLHRVVALKFLPGHLATDPDRLLRFRREARVLAALNHPHIAQIYGLEETDSTYCIAMELVDGETLAERVRRGPIPVGEALRIARDIAEALETAHEKGIVHRDLKPANVKVTPESQVKVLDFGLAKASPSPPMQGDLPESSTAGLEVTRSGIILGTAPYMSPEQAKGTTTDQRTDVFSFGAVLFEMLTGQLAFQGETVTEIIASVLAREPDLSKLPPGLNPKIADLIHHCLQKDLRRRWQAIGDVRVEIETILEDPRGLTVLDTVTQKKAVWKRAVPFLATAIFGALIATVVVWNMRPAPDGAPLRRFSMQLGEVRPVISPDGQHIAYRSGDSLWIRDLNSETSREIPGGKAKGGYYSAMGYYLTWSPDSRDIVFPAENELRRVSILQGGSAVTVCTIPQGRGARMVGGIAWSKDGETIVFSRYGSGIYEVPARGGSPKLLWMEEHADDLILVDTPQGRAVVFGSLGEGVLGHGLIVRTPNGERRKLAQLETGWPELIYSPTGHILFRRSPTQSASIWALPFSTETLTTQGEPFLVEGSGQGMSLSEQGTLVYLDTGRIREQHLAWRDRRGNILTQASEGHDLIQQLSLSQDGNQAVITARDAGRAGAWLYDVRRFVKTQFALGSETEGKTLFFAFWPRGEEIYYTLASPGKGEGTHLFAKPADGFGQARRLPFPKGFVVATDRTADGRYLIVSYSSKPGTNLNLWLWRNGGPGTAGEAVDFSQNSEAEEGAKLSPNERYLAYTSTAGGRVEIYVRPFPEGSGGLRISSNGGTAPLWGPDSTELFFNEDNTLMRVSVSTTGKFSAGTPEPVFQHPALTGDGGNIARYGIAPDGRRFLTVETKREFTQPIVRVVENWLSEFRRAGKEHRD